MTLDSLKLGPVNTSSILVPQLAKLTHCILKSAFKKNISSAGSSKELILELTNKTHLL